jgi:hypothetical protein
MVNCKWCGTPTSAEFTKECDRCWELNWRIEDNPQVALQMLAQLTPLALDAATARANFPTCDRALRSNWVALATPRK